MTDFTMPGAVRAGLALGAAGALAVAAAGCGSSTSASTPTPSAATAVTSAPVAGAALVVSDTWAKAADRGMTAVFGTLRNPTGADITIVSGTCALARSVELHEVVDAGGSMKMQPKAGGFVIPAGGQLQLAPGGNHVMLMGLKQPIKAGDQVTATLTLKDGGTMQLTAIAKEFAGGNESYSPSAGPMSPGSTMMQSGAMSPGTAMSPSS